jgi:hypothetical protein
MNATLEQWLANDYIFGGFIASLLVVSALIYVYFAGYKAGHKAALDYTLRRARDDFMSLNRDADF